MINSEFSAQFDVLWNNITSNQAPGLNEYEKSVMLTKAEYQLVTEYFNKRIDAAGGGFDGSQKRQYDFSGLIRTENLFYLNSFKERITDLEKFDRRSYVYLFPMNYFLAVNEMLREGAKQYTVMPLDYAEYQRLMLKPYPLPVKKGAWRLFTDKKNCNYVHEDTEGNKLEDDDNSVVADYKIMTSWADSKRTLQLTIKAKNYTEYSDWQDTDDFKSNEMFFHAEDCMCRVIANTGWDENNPIYKVILVVSASCNYDDLDDELVIRILQEGFKQLEAKVKDRTFDYTNGNLYKAMTHVDGMVMCSAPSKFITFQTTHTTGEGNAATTVLVGRTFTTHVVMVPMAEIIGKFDATPTYQLRFVRKLMPIILEDLTNYGDDLSINGITEATECMLPEECHQEILERAVTLAKIAWQGGTATQAAAAQNNRRE